MLVLYVFSLSFSYPLSSRNLLRENVQHRRQFHQIFLISEKLWIVSDVRNRIVRRGREEKKLKEILRESFVDNIFWSDHTKASICKREKSHYRTRLQPAESVSLDWPATFFFAFFLLSHFFFTSYNTHRRTGMTNINDILEKKKRGRNDFSPLSPCSFSYLQPSNVYLIGFFCSNTKNVVIFFLVVMLGQLYFLD